jgi:hypothetical protein
MQLDCDDGICANELAIRPHNATTRSPDSALFPDWSIGYTEYAHIPLPERGYFTRSLERLSSTERHDAVEGSGLNDGESEAASLPSLWPIARCAPARNGPLRVQCRASRGQRPAKCLICCRAHARLLARPSGTIACSVLALAKPQFAGDDKVHLRTTERTPMRFLALFFGFSFHGPNGSMINPDGG